MPPIPTLLLVDFDSTLTTHSTLPTLYNVARRLSSHPQSLPTWSYLSSTYLRDYNAHVSKYRPQKQDRSTLAQELEWLNSLRPVEAASYERATTNQRHGLASVTAEQIYRGAREAVKAGDVQMRKGWSRLLTKSVELKWKVVVVSVSWSERFIRGCMVAAAEEEGTVSANFFDGVEVYANEVTSRHMRAEPPATKPLNYKDRGIFTAGDKLAVMRDTLEVETSLRTMYVGDSAADLACLVAADVGICIRPDNGQGSEQSDLAEILNRVGVGCQWVRKFNQDNDWSRTNHTGVSSKSEKAWFAKDFDEILESFLADNESIKRSNSVAIRNSAYGSPAKVRPFAKMVNVAQLNGNPRPSSMQNSLPQCKTTLP